ncbi:MAG: ATP-binding cassette domain-containing protein [Sphaerochaetaceae bacterium]|nr:ATP-binding cassette domain-containing protein [Sphaerochaetaceae bacterium]
MSNEILRVENLSKFFKAGHKKNLKAVDKISFSVNEGETLGIVGESGCGKTTLGRTIFNVYQPTSGKIFLEGKEIDTKDKQAKQKLCRNIQMVFQDPFASLNPRMTVREIIGEGLEYHKIYNKKETHEKINDLLKIVGLNEEHANRFPHEFSGGQRQRIGIARALSMNPKIIICDEPISALDVSIQAQVMNLLIELQKEKGFTYLFIAHDLSMVRYISKNILVMYLGSQMEFGPSSEIYHNSIHPYTQALFSAIPVPDPDKEKQRKRILLEGDVPFPIDLPEGCKFCMRCKYSKEICWKQEPPVVQVGPGHYCTCHFAQQFVENKKKEGKK